MRALIRDNDFQGDTRMGNTARRIMSAIGTMSALVAAIVLLIGSNILLASLLIVPALAIHGLLLALTFTRSAFRNEAEKLFFARSTDANFVLDGPRVVDCNDATVAMLRASNREQVLRLSPPDLSPETQPDGRPSGEKAMEMISMALRDGANRFEWMHKRLNGELFPVSVTLVAAPIMGKDHLLVYLHEISELIAARENEMRASAERRKERNRLAASFESRMKTIVTTVVQLASQMQTNAKDLSAAAESSNQGHRQRRNGGSRRFATQQFHP